MDTQKFYPVIKIETLSEANIVNVTKNLSYSKNGLGRICQKSDFLHPVVSAILYSMLFFSFSYCEVCYPQIELSFSYIIAVQKSCYIQHFVSTRTFLNNYDEERNSPTLTM